MSELLERTDRLWSGQASIAEPDFHPFAGPRMLEELAPGVAFYKAFVNVTAVKTGDGLVLIDTGSYHPKSHRLSFEAVRKWSGELKPAPRQALARELTSLAGGLDKLLERARALHGAGDARLAAHLVDWAVEAEPRSREAHTLRAAVYQTLTESATSTMSKGIYGAAARESRDV